MYYVIQKNVFKDPRYNQIFEVLDKYNLPYEVVTFIEGEVNFDKALGYKKVFVYGSVRLAKLTKRFNWKPGSFYGGNHEYLNYSKGYGSYLLNADSQIYNFGDTLDWSKNEKLFIKPSQDAKVFTGKAFAKIEWEDFQYYALQDKQKKSITNDTKIQVSKEYKIIKEARIWVVNDEIVTSSYYSFHDGIEYESYVSEAALLFAKEMIQVFRVSDAYVLDIALTIAGWKVVEVNCINSAGFYKANVESIILALEKFYQK